jgi:hypothetical protein
VDKSPQFLGMPNIMRDTHKAGGNDGIPEMRAKSMHNLAGDELANLDYELDPDVNRLNIAYVSTKPGHEGKGYASTLVNRAYAENPEHVHWGEILHPHAEKMYETMKKTYGRSSRAPKQESED